MLLKYRELNAKREKLTRKLEAVDVELKALEENQGTVQAELQVLKTEFASTPSKDQESILRQQFILSHSKSYTKFWDNFRLKAQSIGQLV